MSIEMMAVIIAAGAAGGLLKSLLEQNGKVALPKLETTADGQVYVHLGAVMNILVGAAAALTAAYSIPGFEAVGGFTAGMASAFIAEKGAEYTKTVTK